MDVKSNKNGGVYFPNLNSVRFIAAFLVIIHHIEQFRYIFGLKYLNSGFINIIGKLGVVLFFVLSGFLITYLLLVEKEVTQTIGIKKFYVRRILRIWPLYYLIILTALFVFPSIGFLQLPGFDKTDLYHNFSLKVICYLLIFPNLVISALGVVPFASHTWSIGTEEQFYIIWPLLMKKINNKVALMISIILIYIGARFLLGRHPESALMTGINDYLKATPIDCMAIGGAFSLVGFSNHKWMLQIKKVLFDKRIQIAVFIITVALMAKGTDFHHYQYEIYALLFGVLIINLALNKNTFLNLEESWLNYLGKISYGLYMYHPFVIIVSLKILIALQHTSNTYLYPLSIGLTIVLASVSYHFFEKPFITKKVKYTTVVSGEDAKTKD